MYIQASVSTLIHIINFIPFNLALTLYTYQTKMEAMFGLHQDCNLCMWTKINKAEQTAVK
jgi:hypothetical protein